jgi:hypothetical protein
LFAALQAYGSATLAFVFFIFEIVMRYNADTGAPQTVHELQLRVFARRTCADLIVDGLQLRTRSSRCWWCCGAWLSSSVW